MSGCILNPEPVRPTKPTLVIREQYDISQHVPRPFDVTNDRNGHFYISEGLASNRIHVFTYYSGGLVFDRTIEKQAGSRALGLAWGGTYLLVADSLTAKVYHVDVVTGEIVGEFPTTNYVSGIEWDGAYIWDTYNKPDMEPNLIAVRQTFSTTGEVKSWFHVKEFPVTLALDGDAMWVVDRTSNKGKIYKCNKNTGTLLSEYDEPAENVSGLTFDGQHLWTVTTDGKMIALTENH
jgi:outer membrane protein assembly factor BamB